MSAVKALLLLALSLGVGVASSPKYRVIDHTIAKAKALEFARKSRVKLDAQPMREPDIVPSIRLPVERRWEIDEDSVGVLSGITMQIVPNVPVLVTFSASRGEVAVGDGQFASVVEQELESADGMLNLTVAFRPATDENAANAPIPVITATVFDGENSASKDLEVIIAPVADHVRITAPEQVYAVYGTKQLLSSSRTLRVIQAQLSGTKLDDPDATPVFEPIVDLTISSQSSACVLERHVSGWSKVLEETPQRLKLQGSCTTLTFAVQNVHILFSNQSTELCQVVLEATKHDPSSGDDVLESTAFIDVVRTVDPIPRVVHAFFTHQPPPIAVSQGGTVQGFDLKLSGTDVNDSHWTLAFSYPGGSLSSSAVLSGSVEVEFSGDRLTSVSGTIVAINDWVSKMSWSLTPFLLGRQVLEATIVGTGQAVHVAVHIQPEEWLPFCDAKQLPQSCLEDNTCLLNFACQYMSDGTHHAIPDTFLKVDILTVPPVQHLGMEGTHLVQLESNTSSRLTLITRAVSIQKALSSMYFLPSRDYNGAINVSMELTTTGQGADFRMLQLSVTVQILPVPDAPKLIFDSHHIELQEDQAPASLPAFQLIDPDRETSDDWVVTILCRHGDLTLENNDLYVPFDVLNWSDSSIVLRAYNGAAVAVTLGSIRYHLPPNFNGLWTDAWSSRTKLERTVKDSSELELISVFVMSESGRSASTLLRVSVHWKNDPPILSVPPQFEAVLGVERYLDQLTVTDVDSHESAPEAQFQVVVEALFGNVTVAVPHDIATQQKVADGNLVAIQRWLTNLWYLPPVGLTVVQDDEIRITLTDFGPQGWNDSHIIEVVIAMTLLPAPDMTFTVSTTSPILHTLEGSFLQVNEFAVVVHERVSRHEHLAFVSVDKGHLALLHAGAADVESFNKRYEWTIVTNPTNPWNSLTLLLEHPDIPGLSFEIPDITADTAERQLEMHLQQAFTRLKFALVAEVVKRTDAKRRAVFWQITLTPRTADLLAATKGDTHSRAVWTTATAVLQRHRFPTLVVRLDNATVVVPQEDMSLQGIDFMLSSCPTNITTCEHLTPWCNGLWLRGIPEAINYALANLIYKPVPHDNAIATGVREVSVLLSNTTLTGAAVLLPSVASIKIRVRPVADPVILQGPSRTCSGNTGTIVTFEGITTSVDGLRLYDPDGITAEVYVYLSTARGILHLENSESVVLDKRPIGMTLKLLGNVSSINNALVDLQYTPPVAFHSALGIESTMLEPLSIEVTNDMMLKCSWHNALTRMSSGSVLVGGTSPHSLQYDTLNITIRKANLTTRQSIPLFVLPVWTPPSLEFLDSVSVSFPEDTTYNLQGLTLNQGDYQSYDLVTFTAMALDGSIQVPGRTSENTSSTCLQSQRSCVIAGPLQEVQRAIANVIVQPDPNFNGILKLWFQSQVKQHRSRFELAVNVLPVNDPPVITLAEVAWLVPVSQSRALLGAIVVDVDSAEEPVLVRVACQAGRLEYGRLDFAPQAMHQAPTGNMSREIQFYSLPQLVGDVLSLMAYASPSVPGDDLLSIVVTDSNAGRANATIHVTIFQPVAVLSAVPQITQILEDTVTTFPGVRLQTAGNDTRPYHILLECDSCTLVAPATRTNERMLELFGTPAEVNLQLAGITLSPLPNFFGELEIVATVTASWNNTVLERQSIPVTVQPVEDPMLIHVGTMQNAMIHECILLGNVSVIDVDGHDALNVSLRVSSGMLSVVNNVAEVKVTHKSAQRVDVRGSSAAVSMFTMYAVEYCPPAAFRGSDQLVVEAYRLRWASKSDSSHLQLSETGLSAVFEADLTIASPSLAKLNCPAVLELEEDSQEILGTFVNVTLFAASQEASYEMVVSSTVGRFAVLGSMPHAVTFDEPRVHLKTLSTSTFAIQFPAADALNFVRFQPPLDFVGTGEITLYSYEINAVQDSSNFQRLDGIISSCTFPFIVHPQNDPPAVLRQGPALLELSENSSIALTNVVVVDPDMIDDPRAFVDLKIETDFGKIDFRNRNTAVVILDRGIRSGVVWLRGHPRAITSELQSGALVYSNGVLTSRASNMTATLSFTAEDHGQFGFGDPAIGTMTLTIVNFPVLKPASVSSKQPVIHCDDTPTCPIGSQIDLFMDVDLAAVVDVKFTALKPGKFDVGDADCLAAEVQGNQLHILAEYDCLQRAIRSIQFIPADTSDGEIEVQIELGHKTSTALQSIALFALPRNKAPRWHIVEERLNTLEDSILFLGDAVYVLDSDAISQRSHHLLVHLAVDRGMIYLDRHAPTNAIQPTMRVWELMAAQPPPSGNVTLDADLSTLNTLFRFLAFSPPHNFDGVVTLSVSAEDHGFFGSGGPQSANQTTIIAVFPVNDPPSAVVVPSLQLTTDGRLWMRDLGLVIDDVDAALNENFTVRIAASDGGMWFVSRPQQDVVIRLNEVQVSNTYASFRSHNTGLRAVFFQPDSRFSEDLIFNLSVEDGHGAMHPEMPLCVFVDMGAVGLIEMLSDAEAANEGKPRTWPADSLAAAQLEWTKLPELNEAANISVSDEHSHNSTNEDTQDSNDVDEAEEDELSRIHILPFLNINFTDVAVDTTQLEVVANDTSDLSSNATQDEELTPIQNIPPTIVIEGTGYGTLHDNYSSWEVAHVKTDEDHYVRIGKLIRVEDPDFVEPHGELTPEEVDYLTVNITAEIGALSVESPSPMSSLRVYQAGRGVAFHGSLAAINVALQALTYSPERDWNGVDMCTIRAFDNRGGQHERYMQVEVHPTPDPVVIVLPTEECLSVPEDTLGLIGTISFAGFATEISLTNRSIVLTSVDSPATSAALRTRRLVNSTTTYDIPPLPPTPQNDTYVVSLSVRVKFGSVTFPLVDELAILHGGGFEDRFFKANGTLNALNRALQGLVYKPQTNWNSVKGEQRNEPFDFITLQAESPVGLVTYAQLRIDVQAVNDAPVVGVPGAILSVFDLAGDQLSYQIVSVETLQCVEDTTCALPNLAVRDVDVAESDDGVLNVQVFATHGTLKVQFSSIALGVYVKLHTSPQAANVTFEITSGDLVIPLDFLVYEPDPNYFGHDELVVRVTDLGYSPKTATSAPLRDEVVIPVLVKAVRDPLIIHAPEEPLATYEDTVLEIDGFAIEDWDQLSDFERNTTMLSIRLSASRGVMTFGGDYGLYYMAGNGVSSSLMIFEGMLGLVNDALRTLMFQPELNYNDRATNVHDRASITLTAWRIGEIHDHMSSTAKLSIAVKPVDDVAYIRIDGATYEPFHRTIIPEYLATTFASAPTIEVPEDGEINILTFTIHDGDSTFVPGTRVSLRLSVSHGALRSTVQHQNILWVEEFQMRLETPLNELRSVLSDIVYKPRANYHGADSLTVEVLQHSEAVDGGDHYSIPIEVLSVDDPPTLVVSTGPYSLFSGGSLAFDAGENVLMVPGHATAMIVDVDGHDQALALSIDCLHGELMLLGSHPSVFWAFEFRKQLTLVGQLADLNHALSQLIFIAPGDHSAPCRELRRDRVKFAIQDGLGGRTFANDTAYIAITPKREQCPTLRVVGAIYKSTPCVSGMSQLTFGGTADQDHYACEQILSLPLLEMLEDETISLANISVSDTTQETLKLIVRCSEGQLVELPHNQGRTAAANQLELLDPWWKLNGRLEALRYQPAANWSGDVSLSFQLIAFNGTGHACDDEWSLLLRVDPVPDALSVAGPAEVFHGLEDSKLIISGVRVIDVDGEDSDPTSSRKQNIATLELHCEHGKVMFSDVAGLQFRTPSADSEQSRSAHWTEFSNVTEPPQVVGASSDPASVTSAAPPQLWWRRVWVEGSVASLNQAVRTLVYQPDLNWNSYAMNQKFRLDEVQLTFQRVDNNTLPAATTTVQIHIHAVNDQPVISIDGEIYSASIMTQDGLSKAVIDTPVVSCIEDSNCPLPEVSVRDVDIMLTTTRVTTTLRASDGLIQLPLNSTTSLDQILLLEGGVQAPQIAFRATLDQTNEILRGLVFVPPPNGNGEFAVWVTVDDEGEFGIGVAKQAHRQLIVAVEAVNDLPVIHVPVDHSGEPVNFTTDEHFFVRIDGADAGNVTSRMSRSPPGFDLWVFDLSTTHVPAGSPVKMVPRQQGELNDWHTLLKGTKPRHLTLFNSDVFFQGTDLRHGPELWRYSPEAGMAFLVADLLPGPGGSAPSDMFVHGNRLFFVANGVDTSWTLPWRHTDGCGGQRRSSIDHRLYYVVSGGTVWNPRRRYDCPAGMRWASSRDVVNVFVENYAFPRPHQTTENLTYFGECDWDGFEWGGEIRKSFRFSDSWESGAYKDAGKPDSHVVDFDRPEALQLENFAGIVCMLVEEPSAASCQGQAMTEQGCLRTLGRELWSTDGTQAGTHRVADIEHGLGGASPRFFASWNGWLYFAATSYPAAGRELWRTTGEIGVVEQLQDIARGFVSSSPEYLLAWNDQLFMAATESERGREVWVLQDPDNMIWSIVDVAPGPQSSDPSDFTPLGSSPFVVFVAWTEETGREIWITDGSADGTFLLKDICPGSCSSNIADLVSFPGSSGADLVVFQANDGTYAAELWITNGTNEGTFLLYDIEVGGLGSSPSYFSMSSIQSHLLYFTVQAKAGDARSSLELSAPVSLWQTDGTQAGTRPVFQRTDGDLSVDHQALRSDYPSKLMIVGNQLVTPSRVVDRRDVVHRAQDTYHFLDTQPFVLEDVDAGDQGLLTLNVSVARGFLAFVDDSLISHASNLSAINPGTASIPNTVKLAASSVSIVAHVTEINRMLRHGMFYSGALGMNGWDTISIRVHDDDESVFPRPIVTSSIAVFVDPVNQPPTIAVTTTVLNASVGEQLDFPPNWLRIGDPDIGEAQEAEPLITLDLTCNIGRVRFTSTLDVTISPDSDEGDQHAVVIGSMAAINRIVGNMYYICPEASACRAGLSDEIRAAVNDHGHTGKGGPLTAEAVITVELL